MRVEDVSENDILLETHGNKKMSNLQKMSPNYIYWIFFFLKSQRGGEEQEKPHKKLSQVDTKFTRTWRQVFHRLQVVYKIVYSQFRASASFPVSASGSDILKQVVK